jgi:hypothetical protein
MAPSVSFVSTFFTLPTIEVSDEVFGSAKADSTGVCLLLRVLVLLFPLVIVEGVRDFTKVFLLPGLRPRLVVFAGVAGDADVLVLAFGSVIFGALTPASVWDIFPETRGLPLLTVGVPWLAKDLTGDLRVVAFRLRTGFLVAGFVPVADFLPARLTGVFLFEEPWSEPDGPDPESF